MEQLITIELLGERFQFRVNEPHLNPREIADYLSAEIDSASEQFPRHSLKTDKLAVMVAAALNITKQLFELQSSHSEFVSTVKNRTVKLDDMLKKNI